MASTKQSEIWVCPESTNNSLFMSPDNFQWWIDHVESEIVGGCYDITAFTQDAHLRMKKLFVYNARRFECLDNPWWNCMTMFYPIPTDPKRCDFTSGYLFPIGKYL